MGETAAIILAAGKSTRMLSDRPKVLHEICGRPMLSYSVGACTLAGADRILVVVGHGKAQVQERFTDEGDLAWIEQKEQRGTGHAVLCCREALKGFVGNVLVIAGDMPMIRRETLASLNEVREDSGDALSMATALLDDPTGYGRIIRDESGSLAAIVEQSDCDAEQRDIREVNPSFYCFEAQRLFESLERLKPAGPKGEYYLTDVVGHLREAGHGVSARVQVAPEEARGINSRLDLALVNRAMQDRIQLGLMGEGVTIVDPDNTWIESDATLGRESVVYPFSMIEAGAMIGDGCRIGPFARVRGSDVVEDGVSVGPDSAIGAPK